jgi:hypothetical protein
VNGLVLLMTLLAASYIGSTVLGRASARRFGFATGVEWLVLGFVLGPSVLAVVASDVVAPMHPVALSAIGWLALVTGIDQGRRPAWRPFLFATAAAIVTGAAVAGSMYILLPFLRPTSAEVRLFTSAALGLACAETTRHAVRWVVARHAAEGPLARAIEEGTSAAAIVPLCGLGILFVVAPSQESAARVSLPASVWLAITVALGVLLGLVAAALLGPKLRVREAWTVLLGVALLGIGLAARVGLSSLTVAFLVGAALGLASTHRQALREMTQLTERVALLPVLLLVGAEIHLPTRERVIPLVLVAFAAILVRTLVHLILAGVVAVAVPGVRGNVPLFALSFASTGALSVCVALACALAYPVRIGADLLFIVAIILIFGEAVGPNSLRVFLRRIGEIAPRAVA